MKRIIITLALLFGTLGVTVGPSSPVEASIGGCVVNYRYTPHPQAGLLRCTTHYNTAPYYTKYRIAVRCGGGPMDTTTTVVRSSYGSIWSSPTVQATCPNNRNNKVQDHWIEFAY